MTESNSKSLRDIADELAGDVGGQKKSSQAKAEGPAVAVSISPERVRAAGQHATHAMTALMQARHAGGGAVRQKYIADAQRHIARIDPTQQPEVLRGWLLRQAGKAIGQDAPTRAEIAKAYRDSIGQSPSDP